tara:strand:+ start:157 stop:525 length:369 start_codon:yes stop_codon:yes gene_type:complete
MYEFLANLTLVIHLIFILFVVFGGLFFFIFSKIVYIHLPALIWGIYIELTGSICPLTHLENWFLNKGELSTYSSSFIQNYLLPIIYPQNLTSKIQIYLGIGLIIINFLIYGLILFKYKKNNF